MLERALSRVWLVFGVFSTNTNPMFNQLFVVVHKLYFACLSNVLILLNSVLEAPSNGQEQDLKTPEVGCRSEALFHGFPVERGFLCCFESLFESRGLVSRRESKFVFVVVGKSFKQRVSIPTRGNRRHHIHTV